MEPGAMTSTHLNRREAVAELLEDRGDLIVTTGLGSPSYDVMAAGDHDRNYYLWAAMGSAATVGLGLAMSRPQDPVLVVTGDGEMLMGMGALATIAVQAPKNLTIVVLDNGHYGETGMQRSHAGHGIELDKVAQSVNFDWTARITDLAGVRNLRTRVHAKNALNFAAVTIDVAEEDRILPSRDGVYIKNRVRAALGQQDF
ncbi:aldehyde dehydrogenase [Denitrobaculum tricleocarpae]|uniref:Aldehyde dehydrogenase n=2 Tax=Denitrobaculum tricleocarpae TaxID=2591009 RepID=A0A545TMQ3_9PROT|nr:aldehyde dehydrogenase [Denitrobaculum tricleocarpae]